MALAQARAVAHSSRLPYAFLILASCGMFILSACDSGPGGEDPPPSTEPPPEPVMIEKTITPTDGDTTLSDAELFDDDSDEKLGEGETTLSREEGTTLSVRAEADGYSSATESVSFDSDDSVEIELEAEAPDRVTVTVVPTDGEQTLSDAEIFDAEADTLLGTGRVELTREASTTLSIRVEAKYHESLTHELDFESNDEVELELERRTVTLTLSAEVTDGTVEDRWIGDPASQAHADLFIDDEKVDHVFFKESHSWTELDVDVPMSDQPIPIRGDAVYPITEKGFEVVQRAIGETDVTPDADQEVTVKLSTLVACDDGIDNDGDGLTGVGKDTDGDGILDSGDPGCTRRDDSMEVHEVLTLTSASQGATRKVSSSEGDRTVRMGSWGNKPVRSSIQYALKGIYAAIENEREAQQSGEAFAIRFACGPNKDKKNNINVTDIVHDDPSIDGWHQSQLFGVTKKFFSTGTHCTRYGIHATKARNEPPGDGNDDVVFLTPDGENRAFVLSWTYEPDNPELQSSQSQSALRLQANEDGCHTVGNHTVCTDVSQDGYPGQ